MEDVYNGCYANGKSFRTPLEENSIDNLPRMIYDGCRDNGVSFRTQHLLNPLRPLDDFLGIPVVPQHDGNRRDGSNLFTTTIEERNPVGDVSDFRMIGDIPF